MSYLEIAAAGIIVNILMFIVILIFSTILAVIEHIYMGIFKGSQNQLMLQAKVSEWTYAKNNVKGIRKYKNTLIFIFIPFANVLNALIILYQMITQGFSVYMYSRLEYEIQEFKDLNTKDIKDKDGK